MRDKRSLNLKSPQNSKRKKLRASLAPALAPTVRLKIQRLRGEDFFICISKNDLITKLKEQVFSFLKSGPLPDISVEITKIRLIYKGKVLADEKSIEFYHIQNEDTIQLVPFRRRRSTTNSATETKTEQTSSIQERPEPNDITRDNEPIAFITVSTSFIEEPSTPENRGTFFNRDDQRRNVERARSLSFSAAGRRQRPDALLSLLRFQDVLNTTHLRINAELRRRRGGGRTGQRAGQRALLLQLQTLIGRASWLRDELVAELQYQPTSPEQEATTFRATSENGVFSIVSQQPMAQNLSRLALVPSTGDEKRQSHPEEEKKDYHSHRSGASRTPRSQSCRGFPSIGQHRNTGINFPESHTTSPIRLNFNQNHESPRYQRLLDLSPRTTLDLPEYQPVETLRSFFSRILMNLSGTSRSSSILNGEQRAATAGALSIGLSEEHQQQHISTLNIRRRHTTTPEPATSNQTSGEANLGTTVGGRLRNIFVQFLSGLLR